MSKNTTYGSVSMTTIKATPVWQESANDNGDVPQNLYNDILKKALAFLGWDAEKGGYVKERGLHVRSSLSNDLVYKTSVFRFPVRETYEYKRIYEKLDILHVGAELFTAKDGGSHIRLKDFGNEEQPPTDGFSDIDDSEA